MNVLLLAHRVPYPPNKGEKIRTFHHLSFLLEQGHNVTVVTPLNNSKDKDFAKQLSAKLSVPIVHTALPPKLIRISKGILQGLPLSIANFHTSQLQKKVNQLLISNTPDVVMCTSSAMAAYILSATTMEKIRGKNIRLVMDFMDLDSLKWRQYSECKPWPMSMLFNREATLLSQFEQRVLTEFDASLFVTADEKSLLHSDKELSKKVHVVSNGVDTNMYHHSPEESAYRKNSSISGPVLLFTGVMDYFPNEDAVVWFTEQVWPAIKENYPQARFIIAGMQPSRKIQALAKIDGIEVTGYVDDILSFYQQADIMVAPFRVARGIQNKILQAMACGLPVVTSTAGAVGIKCEPGKDLLVASGAADYISEIDRLLTDKQHWKSVRDAGLKLVTLNYSWDTENTKLEYILSRRSPMERTLAIESQSPARQVAIKTTQEPLT